MPNHEFDLLIIGAGSGGVRAARYAAGLGARVAVVEAGALGGTCVNVGCIPKKLLSYAAHYHEDFADAVGFGWAPSKPAHDWPTLIAAKDAEITRLNTVYARLLRDSGVEIIEGWATLKDANTVTVGARAISARYLLVATGGKPIRPHFPGAEFTIVSDDVFQLPRMPKKIVVYGSGYIAVEFASIMNGLGAHTTIAHRGKMLKNFDGDLGALLSEEMVEKGIHMRAGATISKIDKTAEGLTVTYDNGLTDEVDTVLLATGRAPRTMDMGLAEIGVKLNPAGAIDVNAAMQTNIPSIYAIGDVVDRIQLTPVALAEGMQVADALFGQGKRRVSYDNVPTAVFSHPNIGTVGLSEEAARKLGLEILVFKSTFRALRHTLSQRNERTFMKLIVDRESDRVLGVHMVGPDAGEVMQGFAVALNCGATKAQFDSTIGIHPTVAEEFVTLREPVG